MNKLRILACLAIAATIGTLSLLILQADDQPAVISKDPVSVETPAVTADFASAKSKIPNVSGIWLYNGEKLVAQFRPTESAEAFDYRLVIDGQKSPYQLKWSAERKQFEATFEADRGPGKLLLKPTRDGSAIRGLMLLNDDPTNPIRQELVRGVIKGQAVVRADKPAGARESDNILVLETPAGLAAYNEKSGRWHLEEIAVPKDGKSRISHVVNSRNFASVHFDDHFLVFSSQADKWARLTIAAEDVQNVTTFHRGDQFSVQIGFTKYELTAAGEFVAVEALAPTTVAESVDDKPFGGGAPSDRPTVAAASGGPPNISGEWLAFSLPRETHTFSVLHRISHNSKEEFEVLLQFQEGADQFVTRRMPIPWDAKKQTFHGTIPFPVGGKGTAAYTIKVTDRPDEILVDIVWDDAAKKSIGGGTMKPAGQKFGEFHQRWVRTLPPKASLPSKTIAGQWLTYQLPAESHTFSLLHRIDPFSDSESYRVLLQFQEGADEFITQQMPLKWDATKRQYLGVIPFPIGGKEQGTATYTLKPNDKNNEFLVDIVWDDKAKKIIGQPSAQPAGQKFGEFHERWVRIGPDEREAEQKAESAPVSSVTAESRVPDIAGPWQLFKGSEPPEKVKISTAPQDSGANYTMRLPDGQQLWVHWWPDAKLFEATTVKTDDEALHTYLLRPPTDGRTMYVFKIESEARKVQLEADNLADPNFDPNVLESLATSKLITYKKDTRIAGSDFFIEETPQGLNAYSESLGTWDRIQVPPRKDEFPRLLSLTAGQHVAMVVVDDQLLAYSSRTGKWSRRQLDSVPGAKADLTVAQDFAAVQIANQLYGFSAAVNHIDALPLPPEYVGQRVPTLGLKSLTAKLGDKTYALSPKTGKWTTADDVAEAKTDESAVAKSDPAMPDIVGVWFAQVNLPAFSQFSVMPAPKSAGYQFVLTSIEREIWHLTWQPEQNVFEAVKASDPTAPHVLWRKLSEGNALQRYALQPDEDWKATWETVDRPQAPADRFHYQSRYDRAEGNDLIVTETDAGLSAYSKPLGRWDAIEVERPKDGTPRMMHLTVAFHSAGGVIGNQLLGYTGKFGRWGRMTIPEKSVGQVKTVVGDGVTAQVGDTFYVFSGQTGQWTSPDSPTTASKQIGESTPKPGVPDISGLWNLIRNGGGVVRASIFRARQSDDFDFAMHINESESYHLKWLPEKQVFQSKSTGSPPNFSIYRLLSDQKTLCIFPVPQGEALGETWEQVLQKLKGRDRNEPGLRSVAVNLLSFLDQIQGSDFLITETNDGLNAYSQKTEAWDRIAVGTSENSRSRLVNLIVGQHVATAVIGDQLLGYSSQGGKWCRMTIPPEYIGKVYPTISQNLVTAHIGNKTYALSPKTGQWLSPDGKPISDNQQLQPNIASPPTSFSDIVPRRPSTKLTSPAARQLAEQLAAREQEAATLADQIRGQLDTFGKHHPDLWKAHRDPNPATCLVCHAQSADQEKLEPRQRLTQTLAAALDLKFQLEQLQVQDLQARLSQLEQQIGQRKAQRDKILQRRAQELIDGDAIRWNAGTEPSESAGSGDPRRAETDSARSGDLRRTDNAAISPPSTSVHFQGPSSLSVFIPHRSAMLGEGHGCEFPHGPGEFLSYAISLNAKEWKSRISANLDIYSTKDSVRKFLDKHHVWFRVTDEDLDQIESGNFVTKVAYLPHAKLPMLPDAEIETLVSTRLAPQVDPIEEAKRQGEILAVLRFNLQQPDTETAAKAAAKQNQLSRVPETEVSLQDYASAENRCWNELGLRFGKSLTFVLDGTIVPRYGLAITEVKDKSPADDASIRQGYILVGLDQWETPSVKDVLWVLKHRPPKPTLRAHLYQGVEIVTTVLNVSPQASAARPAPVAVESGDDSKEAQLKTTPIPPNVTRIHLSIDKKLTGFSKLKCNNQLFTLPATIDLPRGDKPLRYPLFLTSEWPVEFERQLGVIEILPATKATETYLTQLPVALEIIPEDVHQLAGSHRVAKIVYCRNHNAGSYPALTDLETLVPTWLNPLTEQLEEVNKHGTVVATLLLEPNASQQAPGDADATKKAEPSQPVLDFNSEKDADLDLPARLAQAEGEFKKALLEFNRIQTLSTKNAVTRQELDLATNRRDSTAKQYEALQLQYAAIWRDLELQIKAAQIQHDAAAREISRVERRAENLTPLEKVTVIEQANIQYEKSALALERLKSRYDFFKQAGEGLAYGPHAKKDPPNWDDKSPLQATESAEIADDALAAKARDFWDKLGIKFEPVMAESLGAFSKQFQGGLRVTEIRPNSPAAKADIRVGDIWVGIGRWQTKTFSDLVWINDQPLDAEGNTRIVRRIRDGKVWSASYSLSFRNQKK